MRWGIVATGVIANQFASALCGMNEPDNQLAACASRSKETGSLFAEKYQIPLVFDSYEAMAESREVDAVYIATPNHLHAANTRLFLEHGKHVLCEKPFTTCAKDAAALNRLAEEKGLFLMEALWTYHLPLIKKAQEMVRNGIIGEPVATRSDFAYAAKGKRRERKYRSELAGGALLDVGIYNLAFAHQMFGSDLGDFSSQVILNEFGTDAYSLVIADYQGKKASMTASCEVQYPREGVIYGTAGHMLFPDFEEAEKMILVRNDGTEELYEMPFEVNGFEYQIRESARCIRAGLTESPYYTHAMSVQRMKELDRIRASWNMKFSFEK